MLNHIRYCEKNVVKGKEKKTEFALIISIHITKNNAKKIVREGTGEK